MFKYFALLSLLAVVVADWSLESLNPFHSYERGVTPRRDYSHSMTDYERWLSEMDPFPSLSRLSGNLPMDVREGKDSIDIQMDLPGVDKKDILVTIHRNNELRVTATKHGLTKTDDSNMKRVERYRGQVSRTLVFPDYADLEKLEAHYVDGVLSIRVPKAAHAVEDNPRSIEIK